MEAFDRTPPWSLEAETAVLGALFIDRGAILTVLPLLREADFYREANRIVYQAAVRVYESGSSIDPVTVTNALRAGGTLDAAGGIDYISRLIDAVPTAANVTYHAQIVREKAQLRRVIDSAKLVLHEAYESGVGIGSVAARVDALASELGSAGAGDFKLIKEALWDAFARIEEMQQKGGQTGIPSGFRGVDKMLSGMQAGDLIVVAGRPSMGKTSWVLNALTHAAQEGYAGALVSLEMSTEQLTIRQIASMARIDMQKIRGGSLSMEEHQRMAAAAGHLNTLPLWIDDHPVTRVAQLRAKLTRLVKREGVRVVAVDYLQLMEGSGEENRRLEIGGITRGLKLLAGDLNVPILLLSQLSRAVESRTNHRPVLSDLRESGDIEQDADVVMFLYRPEVYIQDGDTMAARLKASQQREEMAGKAELHIAKQRNGPTGMVPLYFHKAYTRFDDVARQVDDERFSTPPISEDYYHGGEE